MTPIKRIGDLRAGDRVKLSDRSTARVTLATMEDRSTVMPHRANVPRMPVPACYLIWRSEGGREAGGLYDPDDKVELA